MQPTTWKKIEQIFNEAAILPRESQRNFVEENSEGEPEVRENVLRLLSNDRRKNLFLDKPLFRLASKLLIEDKDQP
jgi:hypothetical protein